MAIHDVYVDDASSALARRAYLLAESSEISRKNGRSQFDQTRASEPVFSHRNAWENSNTLARLERRQAAQK
jgi:hypothetical protein